MFNNYKELFHTYVDFYWTGLTNDNTNSFTDNHHQVINYHNELSKQATQKVTTTTSSTRAHREIILNLASNKFNHSSSVPWPLQSSANTTNFNQLLLRTAQSGPTELAEAINQSSAEQHISALASNTRLPVSHNVLIVSPQSLAPSQLDDPRILIEGEGRFVRIGSFNSLELADLIHIASIFVILTLAKRLLSRRLNEFKRIDQLGLRQKDRERLDECVWRLIYYSISSLLLLYSCLRHNSHLLLSNQLGPPKSYSFQLDWSSYAISMLETGFYLHATYALVFEDVWRRDSPMMLVHHLAAIFTTLSIYATRTHQIGLVSTVLRDSCDVLLEVTKLTKLIHIQHGKRVRSLGLLVNCFLTVFAFAFAINQLYYFPLFCLFHGMNMIKIYNIQTPVMTGILTCGLLFLLLDFLWFGVSDSYQYYLIFSTISID